MKERPIIMQAESINAIRDNRKTMTRRVVKLDRLRIEPRYEIRSDIPGDRLGAKSGKTYAARLNRNGAVSAMIGDRSLGFRPGEFDFVFPYADGETRLVDYGNGKRWMIVPRNSRLWVRETWREYDRDEECACYDEYCHCPPTGTMIYRADGDHDATWRSPVFMKKKDVRLWLRVTDVRVERVREISERDARAEGMKSDAVINKAGDDYTGLYAFDRFPDFWDSINAKRTGCSWADNPWVWVIGFESLTSSR